MIKKLSLITFCFFLMIFFSGCQTSRRTVNQEKPKIIQVSDIFDDEFIWENWKSQTNNFNIITIEL